MGELKLCKGLVRQIEKLVEKFPPLNVLKCSAS